MINFIGGFAIGATVLQGILIISSAWKGEEEAATIREYMFIGYLIAAAICFK